LPLVAWCKVLMPGLWGNGFNEQILAQMNKSPDVGQATKKRKSCPLCIPWDQMKPRTIYEKAVTQFAHVVCGSQQLPNNRGL
jgi:hypothetical protein